MLTADAQLNLRTRAPSPLDRFFYQLPDPIPVKFHEGVGFQNFLLQVEGEELAFGIIAAEAEGGLGEVVGPEREKLGAFSQLIGYQAGPRQLDHGADQEGQAPAGFIQHRRSRLFNFLLHPLHLGGMADQRNHDLQLNLFRGNPFIKQLKGGHDDRTHLHAVDGGINQPQPAAAVAQHGVLLGQRSYFLQQRLSLLQLLRLGSITAQPINLQKQLLTVGQKLVQRRVEQPDRHREAGHLPQDPLEILFLHRQQLLQGRFPLGIVAGQDHPPHQRHPLLLHEHVLGAAEADALGPQLQGPAGIAGCIGVGAHAQPAGLIGPGEELLEFGRGLRVDERRLPQDDLPGGPINGEDGLLRVDLSVNREPAVLQVDFQRFAAADTGLPRSPGHHCGMAGHAPAAG